MKHRLRYYVSVYPNEAGTSWYWNVRTQRFSMAAFVWGRAGTREEASEQAVKAIEQHREAHELGPYRFVVEP